MTGSQSHQSRVTHTTGTNRILVVEFCFQKEVLQIANNNNKRNRILRESWVPKALPHTRQKVSEYYPTVQGSLPQPQYIPFEASIYLPGRLTTHLMY